MLLYSCTDILCTKHHKPDGLDPRLRYENLVRLYNSDFIPSLLTTDPRAIANALGACVIELPGLQSELISLLMPVQS